MTVLPQITLLVSTYRIRHLSCQSARPRLFSLLPISYCSCSTSYLSYLILIQASLIHGNMYKLWIWMKCLYSILPLTCMCDCTTIFNITVCLCALACITHTVTMTYPFQPLLNTFRMQRTWVPLQLPPEQNSLDAQLVGSSSWARVVITCSPANEGIWWPEWMINDTSCSVGEHGHRRMYVKIFTSTVGRPLIACTSLLARATACELQGWN